MSKRTLPRQGSTTAGDQVAEFLGPDDEGWSTTTVLDWIGVCPDLGPTAYRLYMIVRSLLSKYGPVRKLTLTELCTLLPGKDGAPSSLTRVRDAIRELTAVGLFTTPEGDALTTSSSKKAAGRPLRIRVNDRALKGYQGHRSAYAKLAAIRAEDGAPEEGGQAADQAGRNSDQPARPGRNSDQPGRKTNHPGQESDHDSGADLGKLDPSIDLSKESSLSDADEHGVKAVTDERETGASREDDGPSRAAELLVADLPGRLGRASVRRLTPLAAAALADGYTPETLRAELVELVDVSRINNRGAVPSLYERALGDLPPAPVACPKNAGAPRRRRRTGPPEYAL